MTPPATPTARNVSDAAGATVETVATGAMGAHGAVVDGVKGRIELDGSN